MKLLFVLVLLGTASTANAGVILFSGDIYGWSDHRNFYSTDPVRFEVKIDFDTTAVTRAQRQCSTNCEHWEWNGGIKTYSVNLIDSRDVSIATSVFSPNSSDPESARKQIYDFGITKQEVTNFSVGNNEGEYLQAWSNVIFERAGKFVPSSTNEYPLPPTQQVLDSATFNRADFHLADNDTNKGFFADGKVREISLNKDLTIADHLDKAYLGCSSSTETIAKANCMFDAILVERNIPGNSIDTTLRDAEYFMMNYIGGYRLNHGLIGNSWDEFATEVVGNSPFGTMLQNIAKVGLLAFGEDSLRANPNNPSSPPGGFNASVFGYMSGLLDLSLEDTIKNPALPTLEATTKVHPALEWNIAGMDLYTENVNANLLYSYDPTFGADYFYSVIAGYAIDEISLMIDGILDPNAWMEIKTLNGYAKLRPGDILRGDSFFNAFGVNSVFEFWVSSYSSIDTEYLLGLSFVGDGINILGRQVVSDSSSVPEPGPLVILATALLGIIAAHHRTLLIRRYEKPAFLN